MSITNFVAKMEVADLTGSSFLARCSDDLSNAEDNVYTKDGRINRGLEKTPQ
jgi:hypothetical protein